MSITKDDLLEFLEVEVGIEPSEVENDTALFSIHVWVRTLRLPVGSALARRISLCSYPPENEPPGQGKGSFSGG